MSALADPNAAREHARAMAGTIVEAMPTLPPRADDLPAGVEPGEVGYGGVFHSESCVFVITDSVNRNTSSGISGAAARFFRVSSRS